MFRIFAECRQPQPPQLSSFEDTWPAAESAAVAIKLVEEPDDTAINLRADYVAKHGAPSAAAPKIFFRYYFVNSSTGEKSGTMLAEVKWEAAAAAGGGEGGGE